jgi:hypothetical protein
MNNILLILGAAFAVLVIYEVGYFIYGYLKYKRQRIVTCPETQQPAGVILAAAKIAGKSVLGAPKLELSQCTRWPEKQGCAQECLSQIRESNESCLVSNIVNKWYAGQSCVFCQLPFTEIHWHDHPPALVDEKGKSVLWKEVSLEKLQDTMATHLPVCWSCHIAETFRRQHPEMVTDRPTH